MAQSYFPQSASAPTVPTVAVGESSKLATLEVTGESQPKTVKGSGLQSLYVEQVDRITGALDSTVGILDQLRRASKDYVVSYPKFSRTSTSSTSSSPKSQNRQSLHIADEPEAHSDGEESSPKAPSPRPSSIRRSHTLATVDDAQRLAERSEATEPEEGLLSVLRLDLKFGSHGSSVIAGGLVSALERESIANLLEDRISSSISHIEKLRTRIQDPSSKVLVTGDLNAGKSTFVNALLGREAMPVDQQPCTTMFCEVHDSAENGGTEEVHILSDKLAYNPQDESTFSRYPLEDLEKLVTDSDPSHVCKIYVKDVRHPQQSLLASGVVDISLIDAPGLNRDSLQTTAVFARQEEIDVVVFVVSAENHFTLSAKEFLLQASNEKAYLFIVVNKFDQIRDKERCRQRILQQVKQLSPRTWEEEEDLVHFVDSNSALARSLHSKEPTSLGEDFNKLETSLRSFVLLKRTKSKLTPATTYLTHVLADVNFLMESSIIEARKELERARADVAQARPIYERLKSSKAGLDESLHEKEDRTTANVNEIAEAIIMEALQRVGNGEPGVTRDQLRKCTYPATSRTPIPELPQYLGLFHIWDYTREVRATLLASLDLSVRLAEDEARVLTRAGVEDTFEAARHLPEGVSRHHKVFVPEAMFIPKTGKRRSVVAGGSQGLGIGLAQREDLLEVSYRDLFDIHHRLSSLVGQDEASCEDTDSTSNHLSLLGLCAGTVTIVGGKITGVRAAVEGVARVTEVLGNPSTRKWVAPLVAVATIGLGCYIVLELPATIPRQVGRSIKEKLSGQDDPLYSGALSALVTGKTRPKTYSEEHSTRISKEARKVMRLAGWEVKERFRSVIEERGKDLAQAEERETHWSKALATLNHINDRVGEVQGTLEQPL